MLSNFYWVIQNEIAGMALPTAARLYPFAKRQDKIQNPGVQQEIQELKSLGIGAIVTLTETPLDRKPFEEAGLEYLHLPIQDMTAPTIDQVRQFIKFVQECIAQKKPVVSHCLGGLGRTGTMLACYLVSKGQTPKEAIANVRAARPFAIETMEQEARIIEYFLDLVEKSPS